MLHAKSLALCLNEPAGGRWLVEAQTVEPELGCDLTVEWEASHFVKQVLECFSRVCRRVLA